MNAIILTCSSLTPFVEAAQQKVGTSFPLHELDRDLHAEPERMKATIERTVEELPQEYDTVLVAMGFCGGSWDHTTFNRRMVIPRFDDCVSLLLTVDDSYCANRKAPGHLYLYENDPHQFSALGLLRGDAAASPEYAGISQEDLFRYWFGNYHTMAIIDTGLNDCYSEEYAEAAQAEADQIDAALDYVPGGFLVLEKLVSGTWDEQFIVAEPGKLIRHSDFFE